MQQSFPSTLWSLTYTLHPIITDPSRYFLVYSDRSKGCFLLPSYTFRFPVPVCLWGPQDSAETGNLDCPLPGIQRQYPFFGQALGRDLWQFKVPKSISYSVCSWHLSHSPSKQHPEEDMVKLLNFLAKKGVQMNKLQADHLTHRSIQMLLSSLGSL
jgi:hypothetical protein